MDGKNKMGYQSQTILAKRNFIKIYLDKPGKQFFKSDPIIVPEQLIQIVVDYPYQVLHSSVEKWAVFKACLNGFFRCVRNWRWAALAQTFIWSLSTSTTFLFRTFNTVIPPVPSIDTGCFQYQFFFQTFTARLSYKLNTCRDALSCLSYPIRSKGFPSAAGHQFVCGPLSAFIIQFRYDIGTVINAGPYMYFLHTYIYHATLFQYVIL